MRELIEKEMELEEMFQELTLLKIVEDEDVIDSDFDQNSSGPDENEDAAEKQILLEEKQAKKKLKKSNLPAAGPALRLRKREVNKSVVSSKEHSNQNNEGDPASNRGCNLNLLNEAPLLHGIRSSSRTHTVQSKQMLAEKLKEYEKKRAAHPKREKVITQPKTQEELLAQAKETEEKNLASLRAFELKEAEKKMSAKQHKKNVIIGPFIREISFVDYSDKREAKRLKLITEVPKKGKGKNASKEVEQEKNVQSSIQELHCDGAEGKIEDKVDAAEDKKEDIEAKDDIIEDKKEDKREARNLLIFSQFSKSDEIKLFQEWRKKPQRAKKVICPFTGLTAKYKDPKTGIPYANREAYSKIQNLLQHKYLWSDSHSAYVYNTVQRPAKGVPPGFQRHFTE
ncbi:13626_t:CDS:2 [Acaulospora colombiana]|uniref:13626_t:CDS:1 n=1 Tax=Acaulospora colombiana TaxID=27376 RepID=A0ACA9LA47_9GLOM|nr:13626_t:CDS:2 [Acaulospora colombiana]